MRTIDTAIMDRLASGEIRPFLIMDMDIDGTHYRYTDCDVPLVVGGYTYVPRGMKLEPVKYSLGTVVDSVKLQIDNLDEALTAVFVGGAPQGSDCTFQLVLVEKWGVEDDETGATWPTTQPLFSFADGQAFIKPGTAPDLTVYAKGTGYATSLGTELMTNGDNEAAKATCGTSDYVQYCTYARDTVDGIKHGGSASSKVTLDNTGYYGLVAFAVNVGSFTAGKVYKVSGWVYLPSGQAIDSIYADCNGDSNGWMRYNSFSNFTVSNTTLTDQWVYFENYVRCYNEILLRIYGHNTEAVNNADVWYFDDISIREVLDDCKYQIMLMDSTSKRAIGYLQAADSYEFHNVVGDTSGNLITNSDNEAAMASFDEDSVYYATCVQGHDPLDGANHVIECTCTSDAATAFGYCFRDSDNSVLTYGKRYMMQAKVYVPSGEGQAAGALDIYPDQDNFPSGAFYTTTYTFDSWQTLKTYFTAGNDTYIYILAIADTVTSIGDKFYIDDIQIKEIHHIGETGVVVVEAENSHVQNWKLIDDGFNMNDTTYKFRVRSLASTTDPAYDTLGDPVTLFQGTVDGWDLDEEKVSMTVASELVRWSQRTLAKHSASCRWKAFKGTECAYAGAETWCDRSYTRCAAIGNSANFGGFRWLPSIMDKEIWWGRTRSV